VRRLQEEQAYGAPCQSLGRAVSPIELLTCTCPPDPRWASWNIGVFVCIRCSGIHRSMGTHISRVKSVDLDAWTDEQLQSILSWGNARANKYWEAKLASGHVPSETKIENFIRTKYELKRWVMDGPIPDPSTLGEDDDVPLSVVKDKQAIHRKEAQRKSSVGQSSRPARAAPTADLIGGDPDPIPQRPSTGPPISGPPPKADPAPAKTTSTKDSLLGLDFFGDAPAAPPRPASTTATGGMGGGPRPDLKQSILSLYASAPKPQPQAQHPMAQSMGAFGGLASPTMPSMTTSQPSPGLTDAFGGLSFGSTTVPKPAPADPFASLGMGSAAKPAASTGSFGPLGGGGFFDSKPAAAPTPSHQKQPSTGGFGGFGDFASLSSPSTTIPVSKPSLPVQTSSMGGMADLFGLSAPVSQPAAPASSHKPAPSMSSSVFNLSSNTAKSPVPSATSTVPAATTTTSTSNLGSMGSGGWDDANVWGGNAWNTPEAAAAQSKPAPARTTAPAANDFGWGSSAAATTPSGGLGSTSFASTPIVPGTSGGFSPAPKVSADEEFGGWASSTGTTGNTAAASSKPGGGFGTSEDLFSNVWQ
jgi:stromal membrane-associated protein